jgi:branched-chain amino acid transport system substrate-binding protein
MEATAKFVASEANADGGLQVGDKKCEVQVSSYDTGYTSQGAAAGATEFASKGIKFVIGPLGATELTGMKPVAARYDMLLAANGFGRDALEKKYPLVFHLGPGPFVWAGPIMEAAQKEFNFTNVKVIAPNDQSGDDIAIVDEEQYKELGVDVARDTYQRGTQDFAPVVSRLLRSKPDLIDFASSPAGDVGTMIKQLRQAGYDGTFARLGGDSTGEITKVAGLKNMKDFFYYAPVDFGSDEVKKIQPTFKKATGMEATGISLGWIPGARTLLESISEAGTIDDTKAVAEAMRGNDLKDDLLGQGIYTGETEFGVNQEMSWPFNMGLIKDGQPATFTQLEADK